MRVNTKIIKGLNPCESRFNNYLEHYKDFNGTLEDFLSLENITYEDKVWVFNKLANITQLLKRSYLCAESVLYIFEDKYPDDKRPRQALDALLKYINKPTEENKELCKDAAKAAYVAAINTDVADNAIAVAANAAYAAAYAAYYAADAVYTYAAYATYAAADAADAREAQQDLNLLFMVEAVSY